MRKNKREARSQTDVRLVSAYLASLLLILAWAFMQPHKVQAQWTAPDASGNINSTNNGNVGVGTTTPAEKLSINGSLRLDGTSQGYGRLIQQVSGGNQFEWYPQSTGLFLYDRTAGQYRISILNNGNVGIGTTTPAVLLHALGDPAYGIARIEGAGNATATGLGNQVHLVLFNSNTTANNYANLNFQTTDSSGTRRGGPGIAGVFTARTASNITGDIALYTVNAGTVAEAMRINSSGNVGIGTSTPSASLEVNKSQNAGTTITVDNGYTTAGNAAYSGFFFRQGGTNRFFFGSINNGNTVQNGGPGTVQLWNYASGPMLFATNNVERIRIDAEGNLGVGVASPAYKLDVAGQIRSSTGGFVFPDGTVQTTAATGSTGSGGSSQWTTSGNDISNANSGNVGIGGAAVPNIKLNVTGNLNATGTITGGVIEAKYQDVAEWVTSRQKLLAGTVVILDPEKSNQVIASTESYDTRVAGVISEQPGVLLGEGGEGKVKVATTGRVKVKVDATRGPIKIGDLLVASSEEGVAMKSEPVNVGGVFFHRPGTLIGKALEPLEKGKGEILVLLSLQ